MPIKIQVFVDERKVPHLAVLIPVRDILSAFRSEGSGGSRIGKMIEEVLVKAAERIVTRGGEEFDDDED